MITTKCPACSLEIKAPESFLGKKVRCKSESCQQIFVIAAPSPLPEYEPATSSDKTRGFAVAFQPEMRPENSGPSLSISDNTSIAIPAARYPNLRQYLRWGRTVALIQLLSAVVIASGILLISIAYPIRQNLSVQDAILAVLIGAAFSLSIGLAGYLIYVVLMAMIEFMHVIIDIESNTRVSQSRSTEC